MFKPESLKDGAVLDLAGLAQQVRLDASYELSGHMARTLVRSPDLRVVFMVMKAKSQIAEHHANGTASIYVLAGQVRFKLPSRTVELQSGQLLVMERGLRHDVEALEDSSLLLTLGWPSEA